RCIAQGRNGYIDTRAGLNERRHVGRDDHGSDIVGPGPPPLGGNSEILQHGAYGLLREGSVPQAVAGSFQANHEPVSDELIVTRGKKIHDIFDARGRTGRESGKKDQGCKERTKDHDAPILTVPSPMTTPVMTAPLSMLRSLMKSPAAPDCRGIA